MISYNRNGGKNMKDSNLLVRVDKNVKAKAMAVANGYGFSLSSLVNAFLIQVGESGKVPLNLAGHARKEEGVRGKPIPGLPTPSFSSEKIYTVDQIKSLVAQAALSRPRKYAKIYLVGSYSKGSADAKSDIDLLVYPTAEADLGDLGYLQYFLSQTLKKDVDVIDGKAAHGRFLQSVQDKEVLLYEG